MSDYLTCAICRTPFVAHDRVIFSHRETFVFKPAHVPDIEIAIPDQSGKKIFRPAAAILSPDALAESRAEHTKTAVVNTFGDWGKMTLPEGAFHFRHQWCEPVRTGASPGGHGVNKHAIRFTRGMVQRSRY